MSEKECPSCRMDEMIVAFGVARASCERIKDNTEKESCRTYVETVDPKDIGSAKNLYKKILMMAGSDGFGAIMNLHNKVAENAIIELIDEARANPRKPENMKILQDNALMEMYKRIAKRRGI